MIPVRRLAYASLALVLLAAVVLEVSRHGGGWVTAAFFLAPDLALVYGAAPGLQRGRLHPRAVPAYNAVHRLSGPLLLGAAAWVGLVPIAFLAGACAWGVHVALDRSLGYGLRTRDGFQRV